TTAIDLEIVSVFGLITCSAWTFFFGVVFVFGVSFGGVDCFLAGIVFGLSFGGSICFTHSRNVISSRAKSFPQPLGVLSTITNSKVEVVAGVVKNALCCIHLGSSNLGS